MKNLILGLVEKSNQEEKNILVNLFMQDDLDSIARKDPCYEGLRPQEVDIYLDIVTKPDFSRIEKELDLKVHPDLVEYWSQIWCPLLEINNKKAITQHHTDEKIFVNLLRSQSHLDYLVDDIEMYTEEMNDLGAKGVFFPIGFKEDGWNILFNNDDGSVYVQDHDPCDYKKVANSIVEFYS